MRKPMHWILTAAMGVGGAAFMGCDRNDAENRVSNEQQDKKVISNRDDAASIAGSTIPGDQIGAADLTKIYGLLGEVAENAFDKGEFDDLVDHFSEADRKRMGDYAKQTFADLDGLIDQTEADFKAKYNSDFDLDETKVFENWVKVQKTGQTSDHTMAQVMVPASHGMPAVTIPIVKDNVAWRIDAPDDMTGEQFKQALMNHLTHAGSMKAQWPSDKLEAHRALSHHVFMAIMNMPVQAK